MGGLIFEIIPGLWIGSKTQNELTFKKFNISCTINCEKDFEFLLNRDKQFEKKIIDSNINLQKTVKYFDETANFIHDNLKKNKSILVYCTTGLQFSPTIGIAYLIKYAKVDKINAINYILLKNDKVFRDVVLLSSSLELYNKIYNK